jgi:acetoin utilization deacetylase AcuC-like enzyme
MVPLFYSPDYVLSGHAFDTTRKARWIAESMAQSALANIELIAPRPLTRQQVAEVHDLAYVSAVETGSPRHLAESQGFPWDAELWPMVLASNGGAVAAALAALGQGVAGSLSSGLHHARRASGAGFCTFNGLALAAHAALEAGAGAVLILDFDAHCGGGTASLTDEDRRVRQIDVSVNLFDHYLARTPNRLEIVRDGSEYLDAIGRGLDAASRLQPRCELCIYNAGMDPYQGCSTGGLHGVTREILAQRERMVFDWCESRAVPIAFVMAGGYVGEYLNQSGLVELHRLTLECAAAGKKEQVKAGES